MFDRRNLQNWTLGAALAVILFVAVAFVVGNNLKSSTAVAATSYATTQVKRGEVEALLNLPGKLQPATEIDLSFQISGVISNVAVQAGDKVEQGQPLARLDTRQLEFNQQAAQAALKQAQAKLETVRNGTARDLVTAQANLKEAQTRLQLARSANVTPEDLQIAQAGVNAAQARYNVLVNRPNQREIQVADADVRKAQAQVQAAQAQVNAANEGIKQAQAVLDAANQNLKQTTDTTNALKDKSKAAQDQAQKAYDEAKAKYDKLYGENHNADGSLKDGVTQAAQDEEKAAKTALDSAEAELNRAKQAFTDAQTQADSAQNEAKAEQTEAQAGLDRAKAELQARQKEVEVAQAEVQRAQAALEKARQGATKDELDAALADLNAAKAQLDKLNKSSADQKEVGLAQAEVDKTQAIVTALSAGPAAAELNQAQAAVDEAEARNRQAVLQLEQAVLVAPFSGQVGQIKVTAGQNVGANVAVMSLFDLSSLKAQTYVSENEIGRVKPGQLVRLSLEVLPSVQDLRGRITDIALRATNLPNGTSGYEVTVLLNQPSDDTSLVGQGLRPGMSSNVQVVVEQRSDVLVVPLRSVKELGKNKIVEVLRGSGQIITVPVTLGVMGEKEVEVVEPSLLLPGDQILLGSSSGLNDKTTATNSAETRTSSPSPKTTSLP